MHFVIFNVHDKPLVSTVVMYKVLKLVFYNSNWARKVTLVVYGLA